MTRNRLPLTAVDITGSLRPISLSNNRQFRSIKFSIFIFLLLVHSHTCVETMGCLVGPSKGGKATVDLRSTLPTEQAAPGSSRDGPAHLAFCRPSVRTLRLDLHAQPGCRQFDQLQHPILHSGRPHLAITFVPLPLGSPRLNVVPRMHRTLISE